MAAFVHELLARTQPLSSPPFPAGPINREMSSISGSRRHALLDENAERCSVSFVKMKSGLSTGEGGRPKEKAPEGDFLLDLTAQLVGRGLTPRLRQRLLQ